jgi:RHS repeat-associated protein
VTDTVTGTWNYGASGPAGYDDLNRLVYASSSAGLCSGMNLSWAYDPFGNRESQSASGTTGCKIVQPSLSFTSNNNRIDNWHYDLAGNLLSDGTHTYTYDAENRIATVDGTTKYIYDADGQRVAKVQAVGGAVMASYVLGLGGEQVTEMNGAGQWVHSNVYGSGAMLATYDNLGTHFQLSDWLGTRRVQGKADGEAEGTYFSYPFGDGLLVTGADATEHHFTGKERDTESGLDYFGARYDASNLGRFMTPDWAAKPVTVPYAKFGDPQSLNLYSYVENGPVNRADADGHDTAVKYLATDDQGPTAVPIMTCDGCKAPTSTPSTQNTSYTATILGQKVPVSITGGTADDRAAIQGRLNGAIGDINQHAGDLSASDTKTIHNIKSITVDDSLSTGVNVKTGSYNMKPSYVMNEGSTTAWIASTIAHDAYHVTQYQQGEVYNKQTAPRLEREANQFQMRVGATFGLTQSQLDWINTDHHTYYHPGHD